MTEPEPVQVTVKVDQSTHDKIVALANAEDRPVSRQYRRVLREWAATQPEPPLSESP